MLISSRYLSNINKKSIGWSLIDCRCPTDLIQEKTTMWHENWQTKWVSFGQEGGFEVGEDGIPKSSNSEHSRNTWYC